MFPALLALIAKAVIFFYARNTRQRNLETHLYLLFLFALSIQNLSEIFVFLGPSQYEMVLVYFGASIVAIGLLLHLALATGTNWSLKIDTSNLWPALIYAPAVVLEILLWFTDLLVVGVEPMDYTYTKIPGPLYYLFVIYVLAYLSAVPTALLYGSIKLDGSTRRARAKLILLGLAPPVLVVITVVTLQNYGLRAFNTTITLPIAVTFFLAVTAYATHQYRIFDLAFYIPWSKVRSRKTAFYSRIRAMVSEVADLKTVGETTRRFADAMRCPIALVTSDNPVVAAAGDYQQMVTFPVDHLHRVQHITVAREIEREAPAVHALMQQHGVAAIVPFYPHTHHASGWMLLGDAFNEQVYTPLDFRMVEQLFDRMAEVFLDKLVMMRSQIDAANDALRHAEQVLFETESDMAVLKREREHLLAENARLSRYRPTEVAEVTRSNEPSTPPSIILLGRDKPMLNKLRMHFKQADQYASHKSYAFIAQGLPDVVMCKIDSNDDRAAAGLADFIADNKSRTAFLLYGEAAGELARANSDRFRGALIEVLPNGRDNEYMARSIQGLASLRRATLAVHDDEYPLLGVSDQFTAAMKQLVYHTNSQQPLLLVSSDSNEVLAVSHQIHVLSRKKTAYIAWQASTEHASLVRAIKTAQNGTLLVSGLDSLTQENMEVVIGFLTATPGGVRVLIGLPTANTALQARLKASTITLPAMRERRQDIGLLVKYFTLQHNMRAGTAKYIAKAEVDGWLDTAYPTDMAAIRSYVHDLLASKQEPIEPLPEISQTPAEKNLEEQVAEFEIRILKDALAHCQGNKSKAARLLGLRPNTLHYKLERYGLGTGKDDT